MSGNALASVISVGRLMMTPTGAGPRRPVTSTTVSRKNGSGRSLRATSNTALVESASSPSAGDRHARPSIIRNPAALRMELHDIAIRESVLGSHLLPGEFRSSPDARIAQRLLQVLVDQPRDIANGLAAAQRERPALVGSMSGRLGVHAHDAEMAEEPRAELAE